MTRYRLTAAAHTKRERRKDRIRECADGVAEAEAHLARAIIRRDACLVAAHGDPRTGYLTYDELAVEAGMSKSRAVQIVQGKSRYSKRQMAAVRQ